MLSWPNKNLRFKTLWGGIYDSWNYIIDVYQIQMEDMRAWWPTWDLWLCQLVHNSWNIFDSYQMQFKDKINNGYFWGIWQLDLQLSHSSGGYEGMLTFWELMIYWCGNMVTISWGLMVYVARVLAMLSNTFLQQGTQLVLKWCGFGSLSYVLLKTKMSPFEQYK